MADLRAAVIGVGSMGSRHARIYAARAETELMAVVSATEATSERVAHEYGCAAYTDYQEMLTAEKPDVVSVAVPTVMHLNVARAALEAGCHVLVEKPIAASVAEGQALIAAAEAADRKLMVGQIVRYDPAIQALKRHIDAGELGRIFQVACRRVSPFPWRIQDVGVVLDLAPHDLDLMRYLTGEEPVTLYAQTARHFHAVHEDQLTAQLRFAGGILGLLEINWLTPTKVREALVLGERGLLRADCINHTLAFLENADAAHGARIEDGTLGGVSQGRLVELPVGDQEPIAAEVAAFVASVREDIRVPVTGADGLAALQLALALLQSGAERRPVEI